MSIVYYFKFRVNYKPVRDASFITNFPETKSLLKIFFEY